MDLTIIAVYTICDDLLISLGHQEHPQTQMTDPEVMTTETLVAARYFAGNHQNACAALKTLGYMPNMLRHSRYNRRFHRIRPLFQTRFEHLAETAKTENANTIYSVDTFPVGVRDNIRISRCRRYQSKTWRGKIASKHRHFYGFKVHLVVSETGAIVRPSKMSDLL